MSQINGIYVDINGDIKCRLGDSGYITITGLQTDDDYKVSFAVYDPKSKQILNETSVQSDEENNVEIPIPVAFTTSLGIGKFFYGIKLTDSQGQEQTVIPSAEVEENGVVSMQNPNTFTVRPLLVEGGTSND